MVAWGSNQYGQLGLGEDRVDVDESQPVMVDVAGRHVEAVFAGGGHSFAVCSDGKVYGWGSNVDGQLGFIAEKAIVPKPVCIDALKDVQKISPGFKHTLGLSGSGQVLSFGSNSHNQVGLVVDGLVSGLPPCKDIAAGVRHSLAVGVDGAVYSWG